MKVVFQIALVLGAIALCSAQRLPRKCRLGVPERKKCGFDGIPPDYCRGRGCCYDNSTIGAPWCYSANADKFISNAVLTALAANGVPQDVIFGLYADVDPGAKWLLAFKDGGLNTEELLKLIVGRPITLPPLYAQILAGQNPVDIIISQMAGASGIDTTYLQYILDGKTEVVLKHILYLMSARNQVPALPYDLLSDLISGKGLDSQKLLESYVDQLLPRGDKFTNEFYKALFAGKTNEAIQWAYLSILQYQIPLKGLYPQNTGIFAAIVRTQKDFPGLISPAIILALAKGEILPGLSSGGQTFAQLFGVSAKAYICVAHDPTLRTTCEKLRGQLYITSKQCVAAGCCSIETSDGPVCFDDILGSLGTFLATNIIDQKYINETVLGGNLPALETFIPWIPNNALPGRFGLWLTGGNPDNYIEKYATAAPLQPSSLRPNFKWRPHGPTAFPFNPRLPYDLLVPTVLPGVIDPHPYAAPASAPLITQLSLNGIASGCRSVQNKDKVQCLGNGDALADGGEKKCIEEAQCCYDPDLSDLSIPACFRPVTYGQCYKVAYPEREECGRPGIKREECLKNVQCCYDSALPIPQVLGGTPWCYYKKRAPLLPKDACSRTARVPCFDSTINSIVSKETCESVGCCYAEVKVSYFDIAVGIAAQPPSCYKAGSIDLTPTEAPDPVPPVSLASVCLFANQLPPHARVDCKHTNAFDCKLAGCCYEAVPHIPGYPWCFSRTTIAV